MAGHPEHPSRVALVKGYRHVLRWIPSSALPESDAGINKWAVNSIGSMIKGMVSNRKHYLFDPNRDVKS